MSKMQITAPHRLIRTKMIRPHKKGCIALKETITNTSYWGHPWYFPCGYGGVPSIVRRDAIGRQTRGIGEEWLVIGCNNPNCAGQILVAIEDLLLNIPIG